MTVIATGRERLNQLAHRYFTEGATPLRQAAAIGLGLFIGCLPIYGLHLPLCLLVGSALGLNRLKLYLAANISNPVLAPLLVFASVQIANRLSTGAFTIGFFGTFAVKLRSKLTPAEATFLDQAAKRYIPFGIVSWWRAHARLRRDPLYREIALGRLVPLEGTLVDVGCGSGLLLSALRAGHTGSTVPIALVGIESDPRAASRARAALKEEAAINEGDLRTMALPRCRALFLLDVLHRLGSGEEQERFVANAVTAIEIGGWILIGERYETADRFRGVLSHLGLEPETVEISRRRTLIRAKRRS